MKPARSSKKAWKTFEAETVFKAWAIMEAETTERAWIPNMGNEADKIKAMGADNR